MRPIKLTQKSKEDLLNKFNEYLDNARLSSNTINFSQTVTNQVPNLDKPIQLYINAEAYLKMCLYVRDTQTELGWHGVVKRTEDGKNYWIFDVMVYPQTVTGVTVNTDQAEYEKWLNDLDDDTFNHLRFQGHSHVNMGVTPSGVDERYYDDLMRPLPDNDYYIFCIMNKRGETYWRIYDLKNNLIYEDRDIEVSVLDSKDHKINILSHVYNEKLNNVSAAPVITPPTYAASRYTTTKTPVTVQQTLEEDYDYFKECARMDAEYERALSGWDYVPKKGRKKK